MLRANLEAYSGRKLSNTEVKEILDMASDDIKQNRIKSNIKTSAGVARQITKMCYIVHERAKQI